MLSTWCIDESNLEQNWSSNFRNVDKKPAMAIHTAYKLFGQHSKVNDEEILKTLRIVITYG